MAKSMTASSHVTLKTPQGQWVMELRSVNNRYLDLNIRLPEELRSFESFLRSQLQNHLSRGKVELRLNINTVQEPAVQQLDPAILESYQRLYEQAQGVFSNLEQPSLHDIIVFASHQMQVISAQEQTERISQLFNDAIEALVDNREREGARLVESMLGLVQQVKSLVAKVEEYLPLQMARYEERLFQKIQENLNPLLEQHSLSLQTEDINARVALELASMAMKLNVEEELTRLKSHVVELEDLLGKSSPIGKRLDFLFQEMNREVNTLGSKSLSIEVNRLVIDLKVLVDQLREQALNLE